MSVSEIPALYYLSNFHTVLDWVANRYADLLTDEEQTFIRRFRSLPRPSQALLVRLVMRKGEHFRRSKLTYAEIGDIAAAAAPLSELGWVVDDAPVALPVLFTLLRKDELLRLFPASERQLKKPELLDLLTPQYPQTQSFSQWCPGWDEQLFSLTINDLCERLRLLFFGNLEQSWSEFVLADLGIYRYEQVAISPASRGFRQRQEVEQYLHLSRCREAFEAGAELREVVALVGSFDSDSPYLQTRHGRLLFKLARQAEREGDYQLALELYTRISYPGARQRRIRVLENLGEFHAAFDLASTALQTPESATEQQLVERASSRLAARLGLPKPPRKTSPPANRIELLLPATPDLGVERAVGEHLAEPQAPVHYVENGLINSLFGLLCWEVIFAPVPGAFFHPFHSAPADLHYPSFRQLRADGFKRCMAELQSDAYQHSMRRTFRAKQGLQSPFVFWGLLSEELLEQALTCLPAAHMRTWFEWLLLDIRANRTGMPDLIQFWPQERRYRMIEVKGPGDRLQDNQRRWLALCAAHDMPVDVCHVQWASP